jgi:predicted RecA/RadA family phage recombinase
MKKTLLILLTISAIYVTTFSAAAQDQKQKVNISLFKQEGKTVTVTITSPNEFYIGGNTHVLHIGDKHFDLNEQNNIDGTGYLKFFIPAADFKDLKEGAKVYLSYGELNTEDEQEVAMMCKEASTPCWSLGKLNKKLLK